MQNLEAIKELLRLAHEQLDSKESGLAELKKELEEMKARNTMLEVDFDAALSMAEELCETSNNPSTKIIFDSFVNDTSCETNLEAHNLEQQAKGVENAKEYYSHKWDDEFESVTVNIMKKGEGYIYPEGLGDYSEILRNQAKALKEQGK